MSRQRKLGDGTLLRVEYDALDAGGGSRLGWIVPGSYTLHASGGPLAYGVTLHVELRRGRPRCRRLEVAAPDNDDAGVRLKLLRDVPVLRLMDEAARLLVLHVSSPTKGHHLTRPGGPQERERAGLELRRGTPTDEELKHVLEIWRQQRSLHRRGAVTAAHKALSLTRATFYRRMTLARERQLVGHDEWPDTTTKGTA